MTAPTDFHDGTNNSKYKYSVCEIPLHAICYNEGGDNRCYKCKHDIGWLLLPSTIVYIKKS